MEKNDIAELRIKVRFVESNQEIAVLEKCFGFSETPEEQEKQVFRTIDETIADFQKEIENKALELNRSPRKEVLAQAMFLLTLFFVNHSQSELSLDIPIEKREGEEKDGSSDSNS